MAGAGDGRRYRTEAESLSATPTSIRKEYLPVVQPDLSRRWN
jgi:hypothetical protein